MSTRLHIVVPDELVERLDQARGIASRSAWVRLLIETAVDEQAHPRTPQPTQAHARTSKTPPVSQTWSRSVR
jgi:metal-responsive CopG/Arc/MetJ family transcriptional regulator